MLNLLNSFGRKGVSYGLYSISTDVIDTEYLSQFFIISEFDPTFTAGKNSFAFNGSSYLKTGSEILIECLDSKGNNLFIEMAKYSSNTAITYAYKESTSFVFAIHVYGDTTDGVGKLILYGTLYDGRTVKWISNITINKSLKNHSRVRFYQNPILEVEPAEVPVLSSDISVGLIDNVILTGNVQGLAVNPQRDTNLSSINKRATDIDYRFTITNTTITDNTPEQNTFNSQMIGSTINLNINQIQLPLSNNQIINISTTSSYIISDVIDDKTLKINIPFFYKDSNGNNTVTNIIDADFTIQYPFINYNNATSSYQTTTIEGISYTIKQSYADIIYRNIRTFSGYVARHKVYRKSLLTNADYSIVADEPIIVNEILQDDLTQNKFYNLLGEFYNPQHISRYWFTSSNNLSMTYSPDIAINTVFVSSPSYNTLSGSDFLMVKNDSVNINRNSIYVPFDMNQFLAESGSAYDSNFMSFKANVQYVIEVSGVILKNPNQINSGVSLYITGSYPTLQQENNFTKNYGINIATITSSILNTSSTNIDSLFSFFTPQNDLYGTLVIVPQFCQIYIKNISIRVYGDDGFSPDLFMTRIPWPISVANESFQIKSELFDINNNLVYSDLNTFQSFDPSGSSLVPFVPGGIIQGGNLFIPNIPPRPGQPYISQSRMLSVRSDGTIVFDPIVDVSSDNQYIYLSLGSSSDRLSSIITTKKSLSSDYSSLYGRHIYWVSGSKQIETTP